MRISLVTSTLEGGGAARVMVNMANSFVRDGHTVTLFSFEDGSTPSFYPVNSKVKVIYLSLYRPSSNVFSSLWNNVRRLRVMRNSFLAELPDVVVSFIDTANVLTIVSLLGTGVPVVVSERIHPGYVNIGWAWNRLREFFYRNADVVVVQTSEIAQFFDGWPLRSVQVIPNPVLLPPGGGESVSIRRPSLLAVGRLWEQKGYHSLLKAFSRVAVDSDWKLHIAGVGPLESELVELANMLGLAEQVVFLGQVSNVQALLGQADIYVMSSVFEGFPNALCEAMAAGLACVSTNCPSGPADIIQDGYNGVLVPNQDEEALADALGELMQDEALRERLATNAKQITEQFSEKRIMALWNTCFEEAIARKNGVRK